MGVSQEALPLDARVQLLAALAQDEELRWESPAADWRWVAPVLDSERAARVAARRRLRLWPTAGIPCSRTDDSDQAEISGSVPCRNANRSPCIGVRSRA
jgi:hypothetical protein